MAAENAEKKLENPLFVPDLVVGDIGYVTSDPLVANAIDDVYYLDPIHEVCESASRRTKRIVAWTWLVACLVNHKHLLESVKQYAISRLLSLLQLSFCTGGAQIALKSVRDMCSLKLGSQADGWLNLCPKIAMIAAAQARVTDVNYKLPPALLPAFILNVLDDDNRYAIVVSDLRKMEAAGTLLTVEGVVAAVSKVATRTSNGIRASAAAVRPTRRSVDDVQAPEGAEMGQCWNWFRDGKCRYGERCRFSHEAGAPRARKDPRKASRVRQGGQGCLECGDKSHGFSACSVRKQRVIDEGAKDAAIAANVVTMAAMRAEAAVQKAELAALQKSLKTLKSTTVAGKFASLDPYYAGNEMSTLFRTPGGPGPDAP